MAKIPARLQSSVLVDVPEETRSSVLLNVQLQLMLKRQDPTVATFILENIQSPLNHGLLEVFFFNYLNAENFVSLVSLLELCIEDKQFIPSNALWSRYLSLTCEVFSLEGAKLIFHNVIDDYKFVVQDCSAYNSTHPVPFLVSPDSLSTLAMIFQKNSEPQYIIFLRDYFRRFYSLYGHRTTFKSISISLVEAYCGAGDAVNALRSFKYLCMLFRDHSNFQARSDYLETIYSILNDTSRWRVNNIRTNGVQYPDWPEELKSEDDKLQDSEVKGSLFRPIDAKSNSTRVFATLDGSIQLNDLPMFDEFITKTVLKHMQSDSTQKIPTLMKLIKSNHYMLTTFIVSGLASNNYFAEALIIMKKLQLKHLDLSLPVLLKDETFLILFMNCKRRLNNPESNELHNFDKLLEFNDYINELLKFYFKGKERFKKPFVNPVIMSIYISLIVDGPKFQSSILESNLTFFKNKRQKNDKIYLSPDDYKKLDQVYDISRSQFKDLVLPN
ncbi:hypothetical protein CANTEDRAFT_94952 [Yamadazyma tenuis ATCC 10573]|uniref:Uncharacterized protein n=2 Tax=Candida tenuis TaxID=2315449 RepID=G3BAH7_CANTC|nr:uncharacterized protein CANTEDRAFT_94952 [Yamadazyma tenuis ATCC 10573]EGV62064.1 hypothetical protein CANTEDRAFT_94952 [Yamadazyma tenuis ATCC 10573]